MSNSVVLTIFGATGDLVKKKIIPALYLLFLDKRLPENIKVLGFARRDFTNGKYIEFVRDSLESVLKLKTIDEDFYLMFEYIQGEFNDKAAYARLNEEIKKYDNLYNEICTKLFYYSVQSDFYEIISENISNFNSNVSDFRLLIEKPYGKDQKSALELDRKLKIFFREDQLYRIDHYLHKKIIRQILDFRFSNSIIKSVWNPNEIKKVVITTKEDFGVEGRGEFYESVGALKDVGQNHLLAIASLILLDEYDNESTHHFIQRRAEALETFEINNDENKIKNNTFRAQYRGYRDIENVNPNSEIETYFKLRLYSTKDGWKKIPFILEAGKKLDTHLKVIKIYFETNVVFFELHPDEKICIGVHNNETAETCLYKMENAQMHYQYVSEYALVLEESIKGIRDYFVSFNEVNAQWRIIDPIINAWRKNIVPLNHYNQGETPVSNIY